MQQELPPRSTTKEPTALPLLLTMEPPHPLVNPNPFLDPTMQEALEYALSNPNCLSYEQMQNILAMLHTARRYEFENYAETSRMHKYLVEKIQRMDEIIAPAKHAYYKQLIYTP